MNTVARRVAALLAGLAIGLGTVAVTAPQATADTSWGQPLVAPPAPTPAQ